MYSFWHDLRYAARTLRNSPSFTVIAVITLGLGMAVNTTIFSVINGLLLRPLPVPDAEQIVVLGLQQAGTPGNQKFSYPDYEDIRDQADCFSDVFAFHPTLSQFVVDGKGDHALLSLVSNNYFSALGIKPALGRLILPSEGRTPGVDSVIVLGYSYWQKRFAGAKDIIGKQVTIGNRPATIIGVAPQGFRGTYSLVDMNGYFPFSAPLGGQDDPDLAVKRIWTDRSDRNVTDFLVGEVLNAQPLDRVEFMMAISILPDFDADICNALTGRTDATDVLRELEVANLLLIPLDNERTLYRYHALFQELLARLLLARDADRYRSLQGTASRWYEARGDFNRALRHAAAFEESRVGESRRVRQLDDARARRERRSRLVEADVAVLSEAEEGESESAGRGDGLFVARAFGIEIGRNAVRNVRASGVDVDVREEMLLHVRAVAAGMIAGDAGVFVEIERDDVAARAFVDDALVHADGCAAGGQSENEAGIFADRFDEDAGGVRGQFVVRRERAPLHATSFPRTMTRSISSFLSSRTRSAS